MRNVSATQQAHAQESMGELYDVDWRSTSGARYQRVET